MCYRVECRSCGKYTWGGCGKHLKSLYAKIEEGNHCMCQSWPGVVIPSQASSASSTDQPSQPATSAQGNGESSVSKQPKVLD
ncbi:hypothetical protein K1719_015532 [Acacia pycnantha]|nr:hypothetical protein K1719_015532 [Acacia pycnantha]